MGSSWSNLDGRQEHLSRAQFLGILGRAFGLGAAALASLFVAACTVSSDDDDDDDGDRRRRRRRRR